MCGKQSFLLSGLTSHGTQAFQLPRLRLSTYVGLVILANTEIIQRYKGEGNNIFMEICKPLFYKDLYWVKTSSTADFICAATSIVV